MQPSFKTPPFTSVANRTVIQPSPLQKIQAMRTPYERARCAFTLDEAANELIKNSMVEVLNDDDGTKEQKDDIFQRLSKAISNNNLPPTLTQELVEIHYHARVTQVKKARRRNRANTPRLQFLSKFECNLSSYY